MSVIEHIHLETKALIIINEFYRSGRDLPTLATFLQALSAERGEWDQILQSVTGQLRSAGYTEDQINQLVKGLRQALPAARAGAKADFTPPPPTPAGPSPKVPRSPIPSQIGSATLRPAGHTIAVGLHAPDSAMKGDRSLSRFASAQAKGRGASVTQVIRPAPIKPDLLAPSAPSAPTPLRQPGPAPADGQYFGATVGGLNVEAARPVMRPTVLIADDDTGARMLYKLKLEEAGFNVAESRDGTDAWHRIQSGTIFGVVLDIKLPGINGLDILSRMQTKKIILPVVVCSGFSHNEDEFIVQTYPRLRFLVKPIPPEEVVSAMKALMEMPA